MLTSLYTGVSGINVHMSQMSVVGNNIANMDTYGFKSSRTYFADIINQSLSGVSGANQIGLGVTLSSVAPIFSQGAFESTENPLDLAVDGSGFFMVRNADDNAFYTRAGQFSLDETGVIIDQNGLYLQGYQVDPRGNVLNTVGNLEIAATSYPPEPTLAVEVKANLQSDDAILVAAFDVNDIDNTCNFATTISVYDSLGNEHPLILGFRKTAEAITGNTWAWYAVTQAADSASGNQEVQAQGTLTFNTSGALNAESAVTYPLASGGFDFTGGPTPAQLIDFDFGTNILTDLGDGLDGVTQFGAASGVYSLLQDGFPSGSLQGVSIAETGVLTGAFTNGKMRALGQVAIANFPSPSGLQNNGKMLFSESANSGTVVVGQAGNEGLGIVRANTLELSNVDIAGEFVRMITAQRGFQANSKVITTSDEVLTELVNLKR